MTSPQSRVPAAPPESPVPAAPPEPRGAGEPAPAPAATVSRSEGALVELRDATRDFGEGAGVFDVNLAVPAGTILGVIGPSGAGKTTTIRLITGSLEPTRGEIRVLDEDPRRFRRHTRERIGYLPQQFMLYPDLTASENVDFVASLFGMLWRRRRRRVREVLRLVDLWDVRNRRAGRLSGGMQRRLSLACALVHEPALLLLDEPTAGIDPILRQRVWDELERLKAEGRTLIVTTQYVTEADECDSVALIAEGRLVALGAPMALRRRAAGGDLIEGETEAPFDPAPLAREQGIRGVRSTGLRTFRLAADDAGATIPRLDELVTAAGGNLVAAREAPLTMDEVFAELVEQARSASPAGEPAA